MYNSTNTHNIPLNGGSQTSSEIQVLSPPSSDENEPFSHLHDLCLTVASASCDLSPEEIPIRLRELLKENIQLKDTLHQNNVSMNEQFKRLMQWQQEMIQTQNEQKEKFEEARLLVQQLRQENEQLKLQLKNVPFQETDCKKCEILEEENGHLKEEMVSLETEKNRLDIEAKRLAVIELQLKEELSTLSSTVDNMKTKIHHLVKEKQELTAMNNELNAKLASYSLSSPVQNCPEPEENHFVLVQPLPNLTGKEQTVKEKYSITELLLQLRVEQDKSMDLTKQLQEEREKSNLLHKQIEELKHCIVNPTLRENKGSFLLQELKESGKKFNIADSYLERYMERCDSLGSWLEAYQGQLAQIKSPDSNLIDKLRVEIASLKNALTEQQSSNQGDRKHLMEAQKQFELLLKDYQALLKSWELHEQEQINKDKQSKAYYEIQMKLLNEQIDNLTAKLVCSEEALSSRIEEVNSLKSQMKDSLQGSEKIEVLQAQVEIYRTDFRMEKELQETILREKEKLEAKNRSLLLHNEKLQEELHHCQQMYLNRPLLQHSPNRPKPELRFELPKCLHSYKNQKHPMNTVSSVGSSEWQGFTQTGTRRKTPTSSETNIPRNPSVTLEDNIYLCPKCNLGFTEFQPLENHVNNCLDKDDPFV